MGSISAFPLTRTAQFSSRVDHAKRTGLLLDLQLSAMLFSRGSKRDCAKEGEATQALHAKRRTVTSIAVGLGWSTALTTMSKSGQPSITLLMTASESTQSRMILSASKIGNIFSFSHSSDRFRASTRTPRSASSATGRRCKLRTTALSRHPR